MTEAAIAGSAGSAGSAGIDSIEQYLEQLRRELAGSDPALIQDALYDAEEFLRNEVAGGSGGAGPVDGEAQPAALARAIQRFGTPREVAEAYRTNDARVSAALAPPAPRPAQSVLQHVFGVFRDPRAYGSLLYMFLSLPTGILYFVWAVTGLALSVGLSVLIFGLPVMLLFFASVRVFSLLEGRLVESLLGVRMPRRPQRTPPGSLLGRLGDRLKDGRTWSTLLYMTLKLPVGIFTFTLFTTLLSLSLALTVAPFAQILMDEGFINFDGTSYYLSAWAFPLIWLLAMLLLLAVMHLARLFGRAHGAMAKAMLVDG